MISDLIIRRWGKRNEPVRKLILWGWDSRNNPSYLILLAYQEFKGEDVAITSADIEQFNDEQILTGLSEYKHEISPGRYNVLENNVIYHSYSLLKGDSGHLPNIKNLSLKKLIRNDGYGWRYSDRHRTATRETVLIECKWSYSGGKYYPKNHEKLKSCSKVRVPFFSKLTYEEKTDLILKQGFTLEGFKLAKNPNEILKLEKSDLKFLEHLTNLFSHESLYMRKKFLKELIEEKPPKAIYIKILELGSDEVLCGLLLELAKRGDSILKSEVREGISKSWMYRHGVKRCAKIYDITINPNVKIVRINEIREQVKNMELIPVDAKRPSKKGLPRWVTLKKKPQKMSFNDYVNQWGADEWIYMGPSLKFKPSKFTNGTSLNHIYFKNLLQEAYIYNLPEIVGKFAWFLDTPKFHYLISNYTSTGIYFKRFVRRIIDEYAFSDKKNYTKALISFFNNYKETDIVSYVPMISEKKIAFNELLNYSINRPSSTLRRSRYDSTIDSVDFKHMRQTQAYNLKAKIWEKDIDSVIEVLRLSTSNKILNYFLNILKRIPDLDEKIKSISTKYLVELSISNNTNILKFFKDKLFERIKRKVKFDPGMMLALLGSSNTDMHKQAWEYFKRVGGAFTPESIVELLFLENVELWDDLIKENLYKLDGKQYGQFLNIIINKSHMIIKGKIILPESIIEVLMNSTNKINEVPKSKKIEIIEASLDLLIQESEIVDWLGQLTQNLICSLNFDDLNSVIKDLKFELKKPINEYARILISLIKAIAEDRIPYDDELIEIIDFGTPRMVNTLVTLIDKNKNKLLGKPSTLLLLFESNMVTFNEKAAEVFDRLPQKQKDEIFSNLIDSPIQKVYKFALGRLEELYGEKIPKDLLIQMLEHSAHEIKAYISNKIKNQIVDLDNGNGNSDIFMYYFKTLALLPNVHSKSKDSLYDVIPSFAGRNKKHISELQDILLKIGGSNIIKDSERALVALIKIKQEVQKGVAS